MSNVKALARSERAEVQMDTATTQLVVESMVIRGDISALSPAERSRYYIQMCESLGLNPATQPFAILRLNGKEILYPTRGATDQLAAIHRLDRDIIDGPRVMKLGTTDIVYAKCKITHPNGRTDSAVATLPLTDPCNVLMKCETKAKRRAVLSILGLAMLDETELDTIPARLKGRADPITLPSGETINTPDAALEDHGNVEEGEYEPAPAKDPCATSIKETLGGELDVPLERLAQIYLEARDSHAVNANNQDIVVEALRKAAPGGFEGTSQAKLTAAIDKVVIAKHAPKFFAALATAASPQDCAVAHVTYRHELGALQAIDKTAAWSLTRRRCKTLHPKGNAAELDAWLRTTIVAETAKAHNQDEPPPDGSGPGGGKPAASNDDADAGERAAIEAEAAGGTVASAAQAWASRAAKMPRIGKRIAASFNAHAGEFGAGYDDAYAAYLVEMGRCGYAIAAAERELLKLRETKAAAA